MQNMDNIIADLIIEAKSRFFKKKAITEFAERNQYNPNHLLDYCEKFKYGHGTYDFSPLVDTLGHDDLTFMEYIPEKDPNFVAFGVYNDLKKIIDTRMFLPMLLSGPTGAGKTKVVQQIHSEIQKPLFRVNVTIESDEDSLMGGFRLKNGETYFAKGPVVQAMEMGATLLLDELDLASPSRILCLQSVLEGDGYLIKKTGEFVRPAKGFTVIATANTKGAGDEDGTYVGTQTLNGAMLDRFPVVFDCSYPTKSIETKILQTLATNVNVSIETDQIKHLVDWSEKARDDASTKMNLEYTISTRRLCDIIKLMAIFDMDKAVEMCLKRFDDSHQKAFMDFYRLMRPKKAGDPAEDPFEEEEVIQWSSINP